MDYVFLITSYFWIMIHIYFHTVLLEKQIPNTFLHNIWYGWLQNNLYIWKLVFAYFLINRRIYLVSLGNPTFSNIFPCARHVLNTFELWTLCARLYLFIVYFSFAPIILASIHRYVNYFDIQVLMIVTETETFNVDFTS